ncbi:hypothetical protein [Streptomyces similanensis]|uniref:Integral membrane protein n=1 Tax=Streptomyces similanensis TaxID=1274988 RepID=A0ABP9LJ41_9ACTN|nr:hypothetical protein HUT11_18725 [Streptomyces seoulensis]
MDKRLEAGWFQRIAWSVLAWGSIGMLVWVPFLYVAIRRGRGSDWGAFAAFALFDSVMVTWIALMPEEGGPDDTILGLVFIVEMLAAALMLLFAVFDRRTARPAAPAAPAAAYGAPPQGPYGYPYGR